MTAQAQSARIYAFQPHLDRANRTPIATGDELSAATPESDIEERSLCREKLFVQVILCDADASLVGGTWSCRAVRVNAGYVEFVCERPLPVGTLVDLWVDLATRPGKFYLTGRSRWTRPTASDCFLVGIELEAGAATDFDAWQCLHG